MSERHQQANLIRFVAEAVERARRSGLDHLDQSRAAAKMLTTLDPSLPLHDAVRLVERLRP